MFKFHAFYTGLLLCVCVIQIIEAGYTSEETDEKSKSLYSAVTSILGSTENSKHHQKHTYEGPPCASGGCPLTGNNVAVIGYGSPSPTNPCSGSAGCPLAPKAPSYGYPLAPEVTSVPTGHTNGGHGSLPPIPPSSYPLPYAQQPPSGTFSSPGSYASIPHQAPASGAYGSYPGSVSPVPNQVSTSGAYGSPVPYSGFEPHHGYAPPPGYTQPGYTQPGYTQPGYTQPGYTQPAPYANYNSHPSHYGYQGPRGYSVLDHSLKTNSEYTEVGSHTGPLQQANNGNGYGSGYGGYNGLYNRPGF